MRPSAPATRQIVTARLVGALLPRALGRLSPEDALRRGAVVRRKIEGVWLYSREESLLDAAAGRVIEAADQACQQWLLAPFPILAGYLGKNMRQPSMSKDAIQPLLRAGLRARELSGVGLLTVQYQPYIAVHSRSDRTEIDRQVDAMTTLMATKGIAAAKELPSPELPRKLRAWRQAVLQHGEFLGLGQLVDGTLIGWAAK